MSSYFKPLHTLDPSSLFILRHKFRGHLDSNTFYIMKLLGTLLFISSSLAVFASNVLELDESNFDEYVGAGKPPALVELYVIQNILNWPFTA